jgi:hypothetical protein
MRVQLSRAALLHSLPAQTPPFILRPLLERQQIDLLLVVIAVISKKPHPVKEGGIIVATRSMSKIAFKVSILDSRSRFRFITTRRSIVSDPLQEKKSTGAKSEGVVGVSSEEISGVNFVFFKARPSLMEGLAMFHNPFHRLDVMLCLLCAYFAGL